MHQPPSSFPLPDRPQLLAEEDLPPLPRQERSRQKRDALLCAGLALFAECGYEATTIEAVAHRAGVAVGGFYQHFRSKRQLLLVLMDALVAEIGGIDLAMALDAGTDVRTVLEHLVRLSLSIDWAFAGVHRAWGEAIVQDESLARLDREIEDWTATLALVLMEGLSRLPGARTGVDLRTQAWLITLLFWKLAGRISADTQTTDPEPVVQGMIHLLYHSLFHD